MIHQYDEFVNFANLLADEASKIINSYFRKKINIDNKEDESPVTIADKEAEIEMRNIIRAQCPDHGIIGEEGGSLLEKAKFVWVLDPIDGTKNYISGSYQFGTLISLLQNGDYVLGIIDQPVLRERWFGVRGKPTTFNDI